MSKGKKTILEVIVIGLMIIFLVWLLPITWSKIMELLL